jgi:hypothetical protein
MVGLEHGEAGFGRDLVVGAALDALARSVAQK